MSSKHHSKYSLDPLAALIAKLRRIVHEKNLHKHLVDCDKSQSDALLLLDSFQKLLDTAELDTPFRKNLIVATQRISTRFGIFPASYELKDVVQDSEDPVAQGGFADIFKGKFQGESVCLKTIRVYLGFKPEQVIKILLMTILEALDVASGLSYLHEDGIIHGDLKGMNVLIDGAGRARLADFGISGIADSKIPAWTSQSSGASRGGTVAWQAPELLDPDNDEDAKNTKESDVYAWGCVAYEIFIGEIPFAGIKDARVISIVQSGKHPTRPSSYSKAWTDWGLTNGIWLLMEETWNRLPGKRPPCTKIVERLKTILPRDTRPMLKTGMLSPQAFRQRMNVLPRMLTVERLNIILNDGSDVDDNAADVKKQPASSVVSLSSPPNVNPGYNPQLDGPRPTSMTEYL
ncbi:hypothetical protein H0H92_009379, partial [Tricholoma furcatifolium]